MLRGREGKGGRGGNLTARAGTVTSRRAALGAGRRAGGRRAGRRGTAVGGGGAAALGGAAAAGRRSCAAALGLGDDESGAVFGVAVAGLLIQMLVEDSLKKEEKGTTEIFPSHRSETKTKKQEKIATNLV